MWKSREKIQFSALGTGKPTKPDPCPSPAPLSQELQRSQMEEEGEWWFCKVHQEMKAGDQVQLFPTSNSCVLLLLFCSDRSWERAGTKESKIRNLGPLQLLAPLGQLHFGEGSINSSSRDVLALLYTQALQEKDPTRGALRDRGSEHTMMPHLQEKHRHQGTDVRPHGLARQSCCLQHASPIHTRPVFLNKTRS